MKDGTFYAGRVMKAYASLRPRPSGASALKIPEPDDPLRRLAAGVLGAACGDAAAEKAVDKALKAMVDFNEIRVSTPTELHQAMGGNLPGGEQLCRKLIAALNAVFEKENRMSLERLRRIGRREARAFLEQLDGVDEYAVASVMLWSLSAHAVPVGDALLDNLREAQLVNPQATRAEVQAFLERHVPAAQAKEFCLVMRSFSPRRHGRLPEKKRARTRKGARKTSRKSSAIKG